MNECHLYQELISRLVDGELDKNEYAALKEHMDNCAECSAMYAVFASLSDIISGEDEPLPEDLHENIMAGVRRSAMINYNKRRLSKPVRNALAAAACAALVLFAARGLSPAEKAEGTVLTKADTAAMDIAQGQTEAVVDESPAEAAAPAATAEIIPVPTASPRPTATPVPTKDVYLDSDNEEAKPTSTKKPENNTGNNSNNSIVVTVPPTAKVVEIPSATPTPTARPEPTPSPVPTVKPTPVPTEKPEPVATPSPAPAAEAAVQAETESAAGEESGAPAQEPAPAVFSAEPEATEQTAETSAPAVKSSPEAEAEPSESPEKRWDLRSLFRLPRPAANNADAASVTEAAPAAEPEAAPVAEEEALPEAAPAPMAEDSEDIEEDEGLIKLDALEKLEELENILDGEAAEEAELPEDEAEESYTFILARPEEEEPEETSAPSPTAEAAASPDVTAEPDPFELFKDYRLIVYIYGEEIYYTQVFSEEESITYISPCTPEDFSVFLESLEEEDELQPSPTVSPEVSPADTQKVREGVAKH